MRVIVVALLCLLAAGVVHAKRVALVIGNGSYAERPLRNPVNDAELMQRALRELGFSVQMLRDSDRRSMLNALREFEARAVDAEVALFYFAGHGAQSAGVNYLLPVDARIKADVDLADEAVAADSVLNRMERSRARVGVVVLDACRDNPYPGSTRSTARGLARMSAPTGTIVAYATAPGETADDGAGLNGVYTAQLARILRTPGLDLRQVFDQTAVEVERLTQRRQRPREDIGLRERVVLLPATQSPVQTAATHTAPAAPTPTAARDPLFIEDETWSDAHRVDTVAAYRVYLDAYPNGRYAARALIAVERLSRPPAASTPPPPHTSIAPQVVPRPISAGCPDWRFQITYADGGKGCLRDYRLAEVNPAGFNVALRRMLPNSGNFSVAVPMTAAACPMVVGFAGTASLAQQQQGSSSNEQLSQRARTDCQRAGTTLAMDASCVCLVILEAGRSILTRAEFDARFARQ